jgi:hypothetical protein
MTIPITPDMPPRLFDPPVLLLAESGAGRPSMVPDFVRELRVQPNDCGRWELACVTVAGATYHVAGAHTVHTLEGELWPARWPALPEPWPHPAFK